MNLSKSINKFTSSFSHEMILKLLGYGFTKKSIAQKIGCSVNALDNVLARRTKNLSLPFFGKILNLYCKHYILNQESKKNFIE